MSVENGSVDLQREREEIATAGRLHWFHYFVVGLSLAVTLVAFLVTRNQSQEKIETRFEQESRSAVALVREQIRTYEDGLWGGVAAVQAGGGDISYEEWLTFAESLQIDVKYPGINGIGVIHYVAPSELDSYLSDQRASRPDYKIHPEHDEPEYLPITYIEPVESNAAAVGLDMAHELNRYTGLLNARDSGEARITGPIFLVQDEGHTPGFLFYAPWYAGGTYAEVADRQEHFVGAVYAPFVVKNLLAGAVAEERRHVGLRITDAGEVLFDEHSEEFDDYDPDPLFQRLITVDLYGRQWVFDIRSSLSFRNEASSAEPFIILVGGLILDSLLFALFFALTRSNRRALRFADDLTQELKAQSESLEESNNDLERFAYVASHDLKTPLRGIGDLTEYLEEDLEDYFQSNTAEPSVQHNFTRLHEQVDKMTALIDGILAYSRIEGEANGPSESLDLKAIIAGLAVDHSFDDDRIRYEGPDGLMEIPAPTYFRQVINNLVSNAVNHHHDSASLAIEVTAVRRQDRLIVSVADNGPGIDPKYHDRIFGVFQTLGGEDAGTGIGLSIVQRIVERQEGSVRLTSAPGQGTTFAFDWPLSSIDQTPDDPILATNEATARP